MILIWGGLGKKNPSSRWDLNPRPSVIQSDALTTWATGDSMVSKGQFVGLDWNRITRLHSQVMIGTQEVKNSLTASRCHLKAYPRCGQPTSKVSILKITSTEITWPGYFYKYTFFWIRQNCQFNLRSATLTMWHMIINWSLHPMGCIPWIILSLWGFLWVTIWCFRARMMLIHNRKKNT